MFAEFGRSRVNTSNNTTVASSNRSKNTVVNLLSSFDEVSYTESYEYAEGIQFYLYICVL